MKYTTLIIALLLFSCQAEDVNDAQQDDGSALATEVCERILTCVSSVVTVEECASTAVACRNLLSEPQGWDDHVDGCLGLPTCDEFMVCLQDQPRPPECETTRP